MARSRVLALSFALMLACQADPQPRSAFEGPPVRTLDRDELDASGQVEGFAVAVVREGTGDPTRLGERVRVHYIALLPDGSELDSSHGDDPLLFVLGRDAAVIEGLHSGVLGMRLGELRTIVIPAKLGYRNRTGVGVPPDTALTFLVELIEIKR
jgi:FKBP-type peptidyl-prolyl cis-trans isomerase